AHDRRQHLAAVEAGPAEVALHRAPDARQGLGEGDHAIELRAVADLAPARVVAILLAPAGIAADGLDVAPGIGADPDVGPGRRDGQRPDAFQGGRIAHRASGGATVTERSPGGDTPDAGVTVADV